MDTADVGILIGVDAYDTAKDDDVTPRAAATLSTHQDWTVHTRSP